jgi:hypothetical protein
LTVKKSLIIPNFFGIVRRANVGKKNIKINQFKKMGEGRIPHP